MRNATEELAELVNRPLAGDEGCFVGAMQLNISCFQGQSTGENEGASRLLLLHIDGYEVSSITDLARFGADHIDKRDNPAELTHLLQDWNVPSDELDNYIPGLFFLLELGLFTTLRGLSGVSFSGLRTHQSTPPRCLTEQPDRSLVRIAVVGYPNDSMAWAKGVRPIVPLMKAPIDAFIGLGPEMTYLG